MGFGLFSLISKGNPADKCVDDCTSPETHQGHGKQTRDFVKSACHIERSVSTGKYG